MLFLIGAIAIIFFVAVYAVVVRGSLGLVKKRLDDEPALTDEVADGRLANDRLPTDIEY